MKSQKGPFPGVAFNTLAAANLLPPMVGVYSGELTAVYRGQLGPVRVGGKITDVWLSVRKHGQEDAVGQTVALSGEIFVSSGSDNETAVLTTPACISFVSGETTQQKTTKVTGDTGITQAVIDTDNNVVSPGDVITYRLTPYRAGTPTHEITDPMIVVEFEPDTN